MHGFHERFDRKESVKTPSNRKFGLVLAACIAAIAANKYLHGNSSAAWMIFALFLATLAIAKPSLLTPLNHSWNRLGLLLASITSPLVLGLLYVTTIIPIGLLMRITGNRPLHLEYDANAKSYWIVRKDTTSMKNQF